MGEQCASESSDDPLGTRLWLRISSVRCLMPWRDSLHLPTRAPRTAAVAAPLGVLAFWCGLLLAARRFPAEYDWRYITISTLVYPDRNPAGWLWARAGLALCGFAGLWWTLTLLRESRLRGGRRPSAIAPLGLGYTCMAACALVPEWRIGIPRLHEFLAMAAFFGICIGMAHIAWRGVARSERATLLPGNRRLHAAVLVAVVLAPIVLAAAAQAYVYYVLRLPWVNPSWRARGVPVYFSFAFWEWVGCAIFSAYMVVLSRASSAP
jgi:hypothetical protein